MAQQGFIQDKLDIKMLELYLLDRAVGPVAPDTLADLAMSHDGVGYFDFAEATAELVERGNILLTEEGYAITDKGRENSAACESSLPYSVRRHCDEALTQVNAAIRRRTQVRGEKREVPGGGVVDRLLLDDDSGNLLTLELLCPSEKQAERLISAFRARPERLYNGVLMALSEEEKD